MTACDTPCKINVADLGAWRAALASSRPVLAHLNADTTWLIQLPYPNPASRPGGRSRFNILLDPWLQGPQSDVASWFSTQWHVVAPSVLTLSELNDNLAQLERITSHDAVGRPMEETAKAASPSYIDAVAISHEFTDHCHHATLLELPKETPVFATERAAELIRSWSHFNTVVTTPGFSGFEKDWKETLGDRTGSLPSWLGVGRVVTPGNALYYHSAVVIAFDLGMESGSPIDSPEAIIYSPHGIRAADLEGLRTGGVKTLAVLHGLHDVRIWMTAQLNLGALNGIEAIRATGAKYWIATHDEIKKGGGFVSWLLRRTTYTLEDAVQTEESRLAADVLTGNLEKAGYQFVELESGEALVLV